MKLNFRLKSSLAFSRSNRIGLPDLLISVHRAWKTCWLSTPDECHPENEKSISAFLRLFRHKCLWIKPIEYFPDIGNLFAIRVASFGL